MIIISADATQKGSAFLIEMAPICIAQDRSEVMMTSRYLKEEVCSREEPCTMSLGRETVEVFLFPTIIYFDLVVLIERCS